jgi:hypothetical protein
MANNISSMNTRSGRYKQGGNTDTFPARLGWWERRPMSKALDDITFKLTSKYINRPDLIAFDVYGRSKLMWVVLQYNNIVDTNLELVEGRTIYLPSVRRLQTEILTRT